MSDKFALIVSRFNSSNNNSPRKRKDSGNGMQQPHYHSLPTTEDDSGEEMMERTYENKQQQQQQEKRKKKPDEPQHSPRYRKASSAVSEPSLEQILGRQGKKPPVTTMAAINASKKSLMQSQVELCTHLSNASYKICEMSNEIASLHIQMNDLKSQVSQIRPLEARIKALEDVQNYTKKQRRQEEEDDGEDDSWWLFNKICCL
jgi:hypothetical protein